MTRVNIPDKPLYFEFEGFYFMVFADSYILPQMIFQQPNPGVHYEYILPSETPAGPQQPNHRHEGKQDPLYSSNCLWR